MNKFLRSTLLALTVALPLASQAQCRLRGANEILVGTGTPTKTPGFDLPTGNTNWDAQQHLRAERHRIRAQWRNATIEPAPSLKATGPTREP
jgi:hypothetical protein